MMIPVRVVIPRVGRKLGTPRYEYADVPIGRIARATALAAIDNCKDPEMQIQLREAFEAADKDGKFDCMEEK